MFTGTHKTQRMASVSTLLGQYHKDGNEFLNHNEMGDETRVSIVNVKSKEQSKQWMHIHSQNRPKFFNEHRLPARS
jgi:hypothetical protein